jgi:alpha-L-arabinofuranosidase
MAMVKNPITESTYTYRVRAQKTGGKEGFLIVFGVQNSENFYWWNIGGWGNTAHGIEKTVQGNRSTLSRTDGRIIPNQWYDIRLEVTGDHIRCYLDNKLIHDIYDTVNALYVAANQKQRTGEIILKVVNVEPTAQTSKIILQGVTQVETDGTAITLTAAASPQDENSFAEPTKIAPATTPLADIKPEFAYTFPPYSVTILKLTAQ